jgi:hypothetical protein
LRKISGIVAGLFLISLLVACNRSGISEEKTADPQVVQDSFSEEQPEADNQVAPPAAPPATDGRTSAGAPPPSDRGSGPGSYRYSTDQIDQMVAPIALYPDALMTQVLMASTYPYDVADADGWLRANRGLRGQYLDDALATAGWDPSVIALCKFPSALHRMGGDIQWTTDLGYAFLGQRNEVMGTVQRLRQEAYRNGHLRTSSQVRVVVEAQYIAIHPYSPDVVYIPYYDPRVVYGASWSYPNYYYPSVWAPSPGYVFVNGFAWGAGVSFGGVLFGGYDWNRHSVYVDNNAFYGNAIYRNTDYYRNRSIYGGQAQGTWAYNARYNQVGEGFARAPYGGKSRGEVRGMPQGAVRGETHGSNPTAGVDRGQVRDKGPGRGRGQGMGQSQSHGAGNSQQQGTGKNKRQGSSQGHGGGKNKK